MLQELRTVGMMALQLPHTLRRLGCAGIHYVAERNAHYPVLLVHGYASNESVWPPLRYGAANLLIPGCGHLTICRDVRLIRSLVPELIRTETFAGLTAPADSGREPAAA